MLYSLTRPPFQAAGLDQKPAGEGGSSLGNVGGTLAKIPASSPDPVHDLARLL